MNNEDKIMNDEIERVPDANNDLNEQEILQFYENNKDAIDLIGGLDMFETLLTLEDDDFDELKTQFLLIFKETLAEPSSANEFRMLAISQNYTAEKVQNDIDTIIDTINGINFLSETKKDFLKELYLLSANKLQEVVGELNIVVQIPCELEEGVQLPIYAHETDAGLDIYAREEITINPGETKIIDTGIKTAIPEGYAILIQPRSGQSVKTKLRIANTPGLIDSGYRDNIGVIIENIEPPFKDIDYDFDSNGEIHIKSILHGQPYTISKGQRFAQMRLVAVPKANFVEVSSVNEIGEDRGGGYGSTGQ